MPEKPEHITAAERSQIDPRGLQRITKIAGAAGGVKLSHETFILLVKQQQPTIEQQINLQDELKEEQ